MTESKIVPLGINVLIIDDDPFLTGMYKLGLEQQGFTVWSEPDGAAGLALLKKQQPHIILLDLLMPKMDGFETLERIKAQPELAKIPVVILSTISQREDIERALKDGAADYFIKSQTLPFDAPVMIKKILKIKD